MRERVYVCARACLCLCVQLCDLETSGGLGPIRAVAPWEKNILCVMHVYLKELSYELTSGEQQSNYSSFTLSRRRTITVVSSNDVFGTLNSPLSLSN